MTIATMQQHSRRAARGSLSDLGAALDGLKDYAGHYAMTFRVPDVSTDNAAWVAAPFAGHVVKAWVTISGAITTNRNLVLRKGSTGMTGGTITLTASSSAAGDVFASGDITALNHVAEGEVFNARTDGTGTGTAEGWVTVIIRRD